MPLPPSNSGFAGNPNVVGLTAISARFRASTMQGPCPLPVHVSAMPTTWTGPAAGIPYEDLEFTWDFGDPGATRTYTNPTNGATVGTNTGQVGPEAVHVYDTPGTYTITLSVRGWSGSAFVTATSTTVVRMSALRVTARAATAGTYTLRMQKGKHARSARVTMLKNNYLQAPAGHTVLPGSAGFFFQAWIKPLFVGNVVTFASLYANINGSRSWKLYRNGTKQIVLTVGDATTGVVSATSAGTVLDDGAWHHVAAWCDVASGSMKVQIDGVEVASATRTAALAMAAPTGVPFALGTEYSSSMQAQWYCGMDIDEAAVWDRPPTGQELTWLYNGGTGRHFDDIAASSPPSGFATGLKGWWSLDEDSGLLWSDSSAAGNTLRDHGHPGQLAGVRGAPAKCFRPGALFTTAPLAYNANIKQIAQALGTAAGLSSAEAVGNYTNGITFDGAQAGVNWTLAPGTVAGGFDGEVMIACDADVTPGGHITATAWDTTRFPAFYFDSTAATNGDGTQGSPFNSVTNLVALLQQQSALAGCWLRIKAGSDFTFPSFVKTWPRAPFLVQKWGTGAKPIIRSPVKGRELSIGAGPQYGYDGFILDNIAFRSVNTCVTTVGGNVTPELNPKPRGVYWLDVDLYGDYFDAGRAGVGCDQADNVGYIGGTLSGGGGVPAGYVDQNGNPSLGNGKAQNLGIDHLFYGCVVGVSISGGGCEPGIGGGIYAHHVYWTVDGGSACCRWVNFGPAAPLPAVRSDGTTNYELSLIIKGSVHESLTGGANARRGFLVDSVVATGTGNSFGFGRQNSDTVIGTGFDNLIIQKSRIYRSVVGGFQALGPLLSGVISATYRDNTSWKIDAVQTGEIAMNFKAYRNRMRISNFNPIPSGSYAWIFKGLSARNLSRAQITDNVIQLAGTTALTGAVLRAVMETDSFAGLAALPNSIVDRNKYSFPEVTSGSSFVQGATLTPTIHPFSVWQAAGLDPNGAIAAPSWPDPDNGDFGDSLPSVQPVVDGVSLNSVTVNVAGAATFQFSATVVGQNSPSQSVTWTKTGVGSIDSAGLFTAPAATSSDQTATVTARSTVDTTRSATAVVTILAIGAPPSPPPRRVGFVISFVR